MKNIFFLLILLAYTAKAQIIYTQNVSGDVQYPVISNPSPTVIVGTNIVTTNYSVHINAKVNLKASNQIHLTPKTSFYTFLNGSAYVHAQIDPTLLKVASFHANGFNNIGRFERFEMGIELPFGILQSTEQFLNSSVPGINPYDYSQLTFEADFKNLTTNITYHREGFYYREIQIVGTSTVQSLSQYPMRVRFAPPENGTYSFVLTLKVQNVIVATFDKGFFTVIESGKRGFLSTGNNRHLKDYHGNSFVALGQNIPFASDPPTVLGFNTQRGFIDDLGNNSGNFFRIRMDPWSNEIEYEEIGVYGSKRQPGENFDRQWHAYELDKTFALAEGKNMYMLFNLLQDQQFDVNNPYIPPSSPWHWNSNPYKSVAAAPQDFFDISNPTFTTPYKNKLRYFMARYGYSPNVGVISLINETDNINNYKDGATFQQRFITRQRVEQWLGSMSTYLKTFYPQHLLMTGYATSPSSPDNGPNSMPTMDIVSKNHYSNTRRVIKQRHDDIPYQILTNNSNKPFIFGEIGTGLGAPPCGQPREDQFTDADFHNAAWSTVMFRNAIGTGMFWWDFDQANETWGVDHRANFNALSTFFLQSPVPFETNDFDSDWDSDLGIVGLLKNRKIEWIENYNQTGTRGFGWIHNSDYFWVTDPNALRASTGYTSQGLDFFNNSVCYQETGYAWCGNASFGCEPKGPYNYPHHTEQVTLNHFQPNKDFTFEHWSTYNNGGILSTSTEHSSVLGRINFMATVGTVPGDATHGDPDFAYKVYRDNISFRPGNTSDSLVTDIIYVDSLDYCNSIFGSLDTKEYRNHKWYIDNISYKGSSFCFKRDRMYKLKLTYDDSLGYHHEVVQIIDVKQRKTLQQEKLSYLEKNQVLVYPNPFERGVVIESLKFVKNLKVLNNLGMVIYESNYEGFKMLELDELRDVLPGTYLFVLTLEEGSIITKKLVKI